MLQKGQLLTKVSQPNGAVITEPLSDVIIYFDNESGKQVLKAETDKNGNFSFDIPVGRYLVSLASKTANLKSGVSPIKPGTPFVVTASSPQNAFLSWLNPSVSLKDNALVAELKEIRESALKSAQEAKTEADRAEQAVGDSVGDGKIMREGAYGLGSKTANPISVSITDNTGFSYYIRADIEQGSPIRRAGPIIVHSIGPRGFTFAARGTQVAMQTFGEQDDPIFEFYHTSNTTVDSNGFIKAASPIIKLFDTHIETNGQFKEEPIFEKISAGVYRISNTLGLAQTGWTYNVPKDGNDKPYFHVIVQKTLDGAIISVHDQFETRKKRKIKDIYGDEQTVEVVEYILSEARDIKPHERWIDLRFHEEPEEIEDLKEVQ